MGTYSTNLSLFAPTKGDLGAIDDYVDVAADVNSSMDIIDTNIGMRLVTSGNLPARPYPGMLVLETDTGLVRAWNSAWFIVGRDGTARGRIALNRVTTDGASLTSVSAETLYTSITFAAEADRRYAVEFQCCINLSAGANPGNGKLRVRAATGAVVANTDPLLGTEVFANVVQGIGTTFAERYYGYFNYKPAIAGNVTVGLFFIVTSGGDTMNVRADTGAQAAWFSVRDVGV